MRRNEENKPNFLSTKKALAQEKGMANALGESSAPLGTPWVYQLKPSSSYTKLNIS